MYSGKSVFFFLKSFYWVVAERLAASGVVRLVAAHFSLPVEDGFSFFRLLVCCCDQFEPLSECVTQRLRQGVDVSQDDVEGEGELLHVGADLWQLTRPFEDGHLDVQDGVLQHSIRGKLHFVSGELEN